MLQVELVKDQELSGEEPKVMTAVERLISKFGNLFITLEEVRLCPYS